MPEPPKKISQGLLKDGHLRTNPEMTPAAPQVRLSLLWNYLSALHTINELMAFTMGSFILPWWFSRTGKRDNAPPHESWFTVSNICWLSWMFTFCFCTVFINKGKKTHLFQMMKTVRAAVFLIWLPTSPVTPAASILCPWTRLKTWWGYLEEVTSQTLTLVGRGHMGHQQRTDTWPQRSKVSAVMFGGLSQRSEENMAGARWYQR